MDKLIFFSPCYRGDLERMLLLRKSIRRFCQAPSRHIVAVPVQDLELFRKAIAGDESCELITQQSIVDAGYFPGVLYRQVQRFAPTQTWRFNRFAGRPGWIIQQIAKLMSGRVTNARDEPIFILDSDLFFVRPFAGADLVPPGRRLLMRLTPKTESGTHRHHIENSRRLLGLPAGPTDHHYMAYPAVFYGDWIEEMLRYIEKKRGKPWQEVLLAEESVSEYSIYGVFLEEILKPTDLLVRDEAYNFMLWDRTSFDGFFDDVAGSLRRHPGRLCTVAQSNLKIPVGEYEGKLNSFLEA